MQDSQQNLDAPSSLVVLRELIDKQIFLHDKEERSCFLPMHQVIPPWKLCCSDLCLLDGVGEITNSTSPTNQNSSWDFAKGIRLVDESTGIVQCRLVNGLAITVKYTDFEKEACRVVLIARGGR